MGQQISSIFTGSENSGLNPALVELSIKGDLAAIKELVGKYIGENKNDDGKNNSDYRAFVDATDSQGNAAVHGAAFAGHLDTLKFLIETCGATTTLKNTLGCTPLWLAAGYGHKPVLEYLLSVPSNDNDGTNSKDSRIKVIEHLNSSSDSPLLAASSRGHTEICQILLEHAENTSDNNDQGDVKDLLNTCNKGGDSPLGVAVGAGHETTVDLLLKWEEKYNGKNNSNVEEDGEVHPMNMNRKNGKGLTPFLTACERNHDKIVVKLLENGASSVNDKDGNSPLAVASFCGCEDVAEQLLKVEFGKSLLNVTNETTGNTPLWLAARTGNAKMVNILLSHGADDTIANNQNQTPLEAAIQFKKQKVIDILDKI